MGFPTKVQLIKRAASEQWYINFPSAVAQAMEFEKGEIVEWIISDKAHLILARQDVPPDPVPVEKNAARRLKERFQQFVIQTAECAVRGKDAAAGRVSTRVDGLGGSDSQMSRQISSRPARRRAASSRGVRPVISAKREWHDGQRE